MLRELSLEDIPVSGEPFGPLADLPNLTDLRMVEVLAFGDVAAVISSFRPLTALTCLELCSTYMAQYDSDDEGEEDTEDEDEEEDEWEEVEEEETEAQEDAGASAAPSASGGGGRQQRRIPHALAKPGVLPWVVTLSNLCHLNLTVMGAAGAPAQLHVSCLQHLTHLQLNFQPEFAIATGAPDSGSKLASVHLPALDTPAWLALAAMPSVTEVRR